jgi:hypothetical protein
MRMNKYSIERLDKTMTFNHSILSALSRELSIVHKFKRIDDYEFTLEILKGDDLDHSDLENILKRIINFCSEKFWNHLHFKIDKIFTSNFKTDKSMNLMIDAIIIKSNQTEIFMEIFIYQGETNLYSVILVSKITNSLNLSRFVPKNSAKLLTENTRELENVMFTGINKSFIQNSLRKDKTKN